MWQEAMTKTANEIRIRTTTARTGSSGSVHHRLAQCSPKDRQGDDKNNTPMTKSLAYYSANWDGTANKFMHLCVSPQHSPGQPLILRLSLVPAVAK